MPAATVFATVSCLNQWLPCHTPDIDTAGALLLGDLLGLLLPGRNARGTRICDNRGKSATEPEFQVSCLQVLLVYLDRSVKLLGSSHRVGALDVSIGGTSGYAVARYKRCLERSNA